MKKLNKFGITLIGVTSLIFTSSCSKQINSTYGEMLNSFFSSYARQPEAADKLDEAKNLLLEAYEETSNTHKQNGLTYIGGANSSEFTFDIGSGIFDAIARFPEESQYMIDVEKDVISRILNEKNSTKAEMYGLCSSSLFESIARTPESKDDFYNGYKSICQKIEDSHKGIQSKMIAISALSFFEAIARTPSYYNIFLGYAHVIHDSINKIKSERNVISIGYASRGFFDAIARQPGESEAMWNELYSLITKSL